MENKKIGRYIALTAVGFILLAVGIVLIFLEQNAVGIMRPLPYVCSGIGAGVLGGNLGTVLQIRMLRKSASTAKRVDIETKDERNRAINNKAKSKAYDMMVMVFAALMLGFTLMQVDFYVVLALVATYLFVIGTNIYYACKYQKEM